MRWDGVRWDGVRWDGVGSGAIRCPSGMKRNWWQKMDEQGYILTETS